ncbi:MAG TPA: FadR family transcriptional regulator [Clostridiales bacterium]|nr:FadR family transcriptional regulator [Clostridiales bacterium]
MSKYSIDKIMLRTQAAEMIEKYILEQGLKEGDRLPSERELAGMLSIGRNTLREGLRKLEAAGIIEIKSGRGAFVTGNAGNIVNMQFSLDRVNFLELLEVRRILEHGIIDMVIANSTDKDISTIKKFLDKYIDSLSSEDVRKIEDADTEFHHAIYKATHNKMLFELIYPMASVFHDLWDPDEIDTTDGLMYKILQSTAPYHVKLYEALADGNSKKAKEYMNKILDADAEPYT